LLALAPSADAAPLGTITEFSAGLNPGSTPQSMATGSDGNLWFTDGGSTKAVGRIAPSGAITEFTAGLNAGSVPAAIVKGPDGNLWFADGGSTRAIGRITPSGAITEFSAGLAAGSRPVNIVAGPDGNVWFTDQGSAGRIGRITPSGMITEFTAGLKEPFSGPNGIVAGPDGNIWFSDFEGGIGRITPSGTIMEFSTGLNAGSQPDGIVTGPDGNLWFSDNGTTKAVGHTTPGGAITEFSAPGLTECHAVICGGVGTPIAGADGNMWFIESNGGPGALISRITPNGSIATFSVGVLSSPQHLALGADGNVWFADFGGSEASQSNMPRQNAIGRITPSGSIAEFAAGLQPVVYFQQSPLPHELLAGPDGNVWFIDGPAIGRITTTEEPPPPPGGGGGSLSTVGAGGSNTPVSRAQIAALLRRELVPAGKKARIATLLRLGGFTLTFKAPEAGKAVIDWYWLPPGAKLSRKSKAKPILVASGGMTFLAAGTRKMKINLTATGKRLLKNTTIVKLTAKGTFTPAGETPVTVTKGFVLKR
jgi:streptogramin lyase